MNRTAQNIILLFGLLPLLAGCTGLGAATSGAQIVYDRHSVQDDFNNYTLANRIGYQIANDPDFKNSDIHVAVFHYEVLLIGTTESTELQKKAARIASHYNNVNYVYNFITVGPPEDGKDAVYDSWLTSKIKSKIIAEAKISPSDVKVVTDNRTVYLMGFVTPREAKIAIDTARYTEGVKHVETIFKYVTYSTKPPGDESATTDQ